MGRILPITRVIFPPDSCRQWKSFLSVGQHAVVFVIFQCVWVIFSPFVKHALPDVNHFLYFGLFWRILRVFQFAPLQKGDGMFEHTGVNILFGDIHLHFCRDPNHSFGKFLHHQVLVYFCLFSYPRDHSLPLGKKQFHLGLFGILDAWKPPGYMFELSQTQQHAILQIQDVILLLTVYQKVRYDPVTAKIASSFKQGLALYVIDEGNGIPQSILHDWKYAQNALSFQVFLHFPLKHCYGIIIIDLVLFPYPPSNYNKFHFFQHFGYMKYFDVFFTNMLYSDLSIPFGNNHFLICSKFIPSAHSDVRNLFPELLLLIDVVLHVFLILIFNFVLAQYGQILDDPQLLRYNFILVNIWNLFLTNSINSVVFQRWIRRWLKRIVIFLQQVVCNCFYQFLFISLDSGRFKDFISKINFCLFVDHFL